MMDRCRCLTFPHTFPSWLGLLFIGRRSRIWGSANFEGHRWNKAQSQIHSAPRKPLITYVLAPHPYSIVSRAKAEWWHHRSTGEFPPNSMTANWCGTSLVMTPFAPIWTRRHPLVSFHRWKSSSTLTCTPNHELVNSHCESMALARICTLCPHRRRLSCQYRCCNPRLIFECSCALRPVLFEHVQRCSPKWQCYIQLHMPVTA